MDALPGMQLLLADAVPAQAWRNGGGRTRELLAWPAPQDWRVRVSRADIDRDGPFSAFPGVQRWFAVLQGQGVALQFSDGLRQLGAEDEPLCFDGAAAPGCTLLGGPTQDLNLMLRGARGSLQRCQAGRVWQSAHALRGLYTTVAGHWQSDVASGEVPAHSLLWTTGGDTGAWVFRPLDPAAQGPAWWLGCTLED